MSLSIFGLVIGMSEHRLSYVKEVRFPDVVASEGFNLAVGMCFEGVPQITIDLI